MSKDKRVPGWHGTTIVGVRKGTRSSLAGRRPGVCSVGQTVMKNNATKVRRLAGGKVIGGFAGATADASRCSSGSRRSSSSIRPA